MNKYGIGFIIFIFLLFGTAGCQEHAAEKTSLNITAVLNSLSIPAMYTFEGRPLVPKPWEMSMSGDSSGEYHFGTYSGGKLVYFNRTTWSSIINRSGDWKTVYKENITECKNAQDCATYDNGTSMESLIQKLLHHFNTTDAIEFRIEDNVCYSSGKYTFCIRDNQVVYFRSAIGSDYGEWFMPGSLLSLQYILDDKRDEANFFYQVDKREKECMGDCRNSAYFEFLQKLNAPDEPCFNYTVTLNGGPYGRPLPLSSYCAAVYAVRDSYNSSPADPLDRMNPEYVVKNHLIYSRVWVANCSSPHIEKIDSEHKKIGSKSGLSCYTIIKSRDCPADYNMYSYFCRIVCFDTHTTFLTNSYLFTTENQGNGQNIYNGFEKQGFALNDSQKDALKLMCTSG